MNKEHIQRIEHARLKYKPGNITCLFIAEAPPSDPGRFSYFEEVWEQDSLYLELMKMLFPDKSEGIISITGYPHISTSRLRNNKEEYLKRFKEKGYYLIDALDYPMPYAYSRTRDKIEYISNQRDFIVRKIEKLINKSTPIVLISTPVFQAIQATLRYHDFNVIHHEAIAFPGSGQQANFREKMMKLLPKLP
jgi:hypothetical protein